MTPPQPAAAAGGGSRLRIALLAVVAVVVAAVVTLSIHASRGGGETSAVTSTDPAAFVLPRLAGSAGSGDVRLSDLRGKPTVLDFFASWCTACEGELPGFARVSTALRGRVNFVGVNAFETGDGLAMARRFGIDWWPLARDVGGQQDSGLHDNLRAQGVPISALYDAAGHPVFVSPGALTEATPRADLQRYPGSS